jgi:L-2-hydroxyglutarate oxidase LhgO
MTAKTDVVVIGAGVVGLAVARSFALSGKGVVVVEKAPTICTGTSPRSSEVIHAGIHCPANSLKTLLCVEGREQLYAFCESHGVATRRLGKLIIATDFDEEARLQSILTQAIDNGVEDLEWLTPSQVAVLEPEIGCTKALFSPSTGIVDAQGLMLALQAEFENLGVDFAF